MTLGWYPLALTGQANYSSLAFDNTNSPNHMKKTILLAALTAIAAFAAGYFTCLKVNTDSVEAHDFKVQLIDAQNAALEKAEIVMDNNDLWDADGSDDMADYLELCCEVDSLWKTQL